MATLAEPPTGTWKARTTRTRPPALGYQSPLPPARIYPNAIASIEAWCREQKGKNFAELDAAGQDEVLKLVADGKVGLPPDLRDFFGLLLQNTKEGYFTDPVYGGNHKMAAWGAHWPSHPKGWRFP